MTGETGRDETPAPPGQVLSAGFMASVASAAAFAAFVFAQDLSAPSSLAIGLFLGSLFVGLLHALVIGIPAYLLLREKWPLTWGRSLVGGFAVGGLPWGLFALSLGSPWAEVAFTVGLVGTAGAIGGLAFAAMLKS